VEKQVAVVDFIEAPLGVEEAHMALQLFAVPEGIGQLVNDRALLVGELVGIVGVDRREIDVLQRICDAVDADALVLVVDLVQQESPAAGVICGRHDKEKRKEGVSGNLSRSPLIHRMKSLLRETAVKAFRALTAVFFAALVRLPTGEMRNYRVR